MLRRLLPVTGAALLVSVIYCAWVFYSRWSENRRIEREAAQSKLEFDQAKLNMIGSDLKIMSFYAQPSIHRGQQALICYGVANAKSVRIEPAIETLTQSLSQCIHAAPQSTTDYTLTPEHGAGHSVLKTIAVTVQ